MFLAALARHMYPHFSATRVHRQMKDNALILALQALFLNRGHTTKFSAIVSAFVAINEGPRPFVNNGIGILAFALELALASILHLGEKTGKTDLGLVLCHKLTFLRMDCQGQSAKNFLANKSVHWRQTELDW